jgi:hypothetical protein
MLDFEPDFPELDQWLVPRVPCYAITAEKQRKKCAVFPLIRGWNRPIFHHAKERSGCL